MSLNVFEAARELGIGKLVAAGSVCAYPKFTPVPFSEDEIWNGYPEESNAPYGLAKKMNFVLSDAYRRQYGLDSCVPVMANLYGPGDNFDLEDSHVIAAMVHKYARGHRAGRARGRALGNRRADPRSSSTSTTPLARCSSVPRGSTSPSRSTSAPGWRRGSAISPRRSARLTGYEGKTVWDTSRPDGQPKRYLDVTRARELIGFEAEMPLEEGLRRTIESFRSTDMPVAAT